MIFETLPDKKRDAAQHEVWLKQLRCGHNELNPEMVMVGIVRNQVVHVSKKLVYQWWGLTLVQWNQVKKMSSNGATYGQVADFVYGCLDNDESSVTQ